ncbi:uncharacterized protein VNE69_04106 [Vairimorpha necatrix]|uniref:Uncharacterized protein n=2 Tax=Vairimorpha necatrix TaxID=6039 RepID=A0AAX4JBE5_9MICR
MISIKNFSFILLVKATGYLNYKLETVVKNQLTSENFFTYDSMNSEYEKHYIDICAIESEISSTHKSSKKIFSFLMSDQFDKIIEICIEKYFKQKKINQKYNVLVFTINTSKNHRIIIKKLKEYNLEIKNDENTFFYDAIIEDNSPIDNFISHIIENPNCVNYVAKLKTTCPLVYYFVYEINTIYHFVEINILDLEFEKDFIAHLKYKNLKRKDKGRFLTHILKIFDFFDLNEIYANSQYPRKVISKKHNFSDMDLKNHTFIIDSEKATIKYANNKNTIIFSQNLESIDSYDVTIKKRVLNRKIFNDFKRLVNFINKNKNNINEVNLFMRYIERNYSLIKIMKSIYENADSAIHICFEVICTSSNLIRKGEMDILKNDISILDKAILFIQGMNIDQNLNNIINYITSMDNDITFMIKVCLMMEFENHVNNHYINEKLYKFLHDISRSINASDENKIDLVLLFEEIVKYQEMLSSSVSDTWENISMAFLKLKEKIEKLN